MATSALARRYAQAYFDLAREEGEVETRGSALRDAAAALGDGTVHAALANPRVAATQRIGMAEAVLGESAAPPVRNLVRLLVERGRLALITEVVEEYARLADKASGVQRAEVTTAVPVDDALRSRIEAALQQQLGGTVTTVIRQDPAILGGLVIRIGDHVIDSSVRTRLHQLQAQLA